MRANWLEMIAGFSLTLCLLFYSLALYYAYVMQSDLIRQRPQTRRLLFWLVGPFGHAKYFPESTVRKKLALCLLGMFAFGWLGFEAWMKH